MKKQAKKLFSISLIVAISLLAVLIGCASTEKSASPITILYTNDVHTYIDNDGLRYSTVAGYKASLGDDVLLVDAGDHIQGTVYGTVDSGHTIVDLMNATGYTVATLGNHEFDYDMVGAMNAISWADYDYVSCNIYHNGKLLLEPYKIYKVGGKKVAFVGFTTPETITKSTPKYFMDENGKIVYSFSEGDEGALLYKTAQDAIDKAAKKADYVIGLGHMGVDESSSPYTSEDIIMNTTGLTAFIDGHSHTVMEMKEVKDKSGKTIILTQTGCYLAKLGEMTIAPDGTVTTKLLTAEDLASVTPDENVKAMEDAFIEEVDSVLGQVIGHTDVKLSVKDKEGKRIVRMQQTNIGDFCADAFYSLFDDLGYEVDGAIMNGGGIRADLEGDITYKDLQTVFPWGNVMCLVDVTGQQLLDALEWSAKSVNAEATAEDGGFLSVSGIKYTINVGTPSTVQKDETGIWTGGPTGKYRVTDVEILDRNTGKYVPIDLNKHYAIAGINYTLREMGDGFNMFKGENIVDYVAVDYMALATYLMKFPVNGSTGLPTISAGSGYDEIEASGRITIIR